MWVTCICHTYRQMGGPGAAPTETAARRTARLTHARMWAQGKAAIDVVCNPLGKSGGSAIQQLMIIGFGSLAASTPYLGVILLIVVLAWLAAASSLNKQARSGTRRVKNPPDSI